MWKCLSMLSNYVSVIMSTRDPTYERVQKAIAHLQRSTVEYELILLNRNREWKTGEIINQGIHASVGDHIAFLCDDCFVEPNALEEMMKVLEDKNVGLAGAFLRYPNGQIQHAGGAFHVIFDEEAKVANGIKIVHIGNNSPLLEKKERYDFMTGAFLMMRRDVVEDIGGYDTNCQLAWGDVDYSFRARQAGYRIVLADKAKAIHMEGTTRRSMLWLSTVERDDLKWFLSKWGRSEFMKYREETKRRVFSVGAQ